MTMNLTAALTSTPDLSNLTTYVSLFPQLLSQLGSAKNITILAPSNAAFTKLLASPAGNAIKMNNTGLIQAVLSYHVLNGTHPASSISNASFVPTMLMDKMFANVTGGQVVEGMKKGNNVVFTSGLKMLSTVTKADVNFTGGIIHIIDTVLTPPLNVSSTALDTNLTALYGAVNASGLMETVNTTPDLTIFAPNNAAFQSIGSALGNLTKQQIASILSYHAVNGTVGYSSTLMNGTSLKTLAGNNVTITKNGDNVFVNSAKVLVADVLVANGVIHVIDNVLNPNMTMATPVATASKQAPAFSGASSVTNIPLTSGQPTATMTVAGLDGGPTSMMSGAGGAASSTSKAAAAPMKTGAMGAAALFGAGAAWLAV
ncbi:MAG: hypothetical protein M1812_005772 [Candelaria pacifica]|nr:MAG: hypothetical protein M1812_005772 [Candelaria pacifica]